LITRQVNVFEIDEVWGADLVEMQEWSKQNNGFRYMLNVIDIFSKYAWSIPLKDKRGDTVTEAFIKIVNNSKRIPKYLWVDKGKEFYNKNMDLWLKQNNIIRYSTFGQHKSAIIERFNRTLKEIMWKRFTAENTRNWIHILDKLIMEYNNRIHSTIGMSPKEASLSKNYNEVLQNTLNKTKIHSNKNLKFKIGDKVRISRLKGIFEKGYLPNWSEELFTIDKINNSYPITYKLKDLNNEVLEGGFYEEELQKTEQEIYRVEKVIRKKKINGIDHALVKWSGYSDKHNLWIPVKDLTKL